VGGGGREHALAWKMVQSPRLRKLFIAPGNPGTAEFGENVSLLPTDLQGLTDFAEANQIDLTVVGPEDPLAAGLTSRFHQRGLPIFGSSCTAASLECSKVFAKHLMDAAGVPTAQYRVFRDFWSAWDYICATGVPLVIKANGLAAGKGVFVCREITEALRALVILMRDRVFGSAGDTVVIEELLEGREVSIHAFTDGLRYCLMPPAQDHKTLSDGGRGPNTGGMGVVAPVPWFSGPENEAAARQIVERTLESMRYRGYEFRGCLYPGLMVTANGSKVLEYNVRFGDPEAQVYMRLLRSDLLEVTEACAAGGLTQPVDWYDGFAVCVVLAAPGYPEKPIGGSPIDGIERAESVPGVVVFHSGTKINQITGELITAGGRVLSVTAIGATLAEAQSRAYRAIGFIHFEEMHFRRDIGAYCQ